MNRFQSIGMRVATVACLGGFGVPTCAPTAAQRQAGIDAYVRANAPSWVLSPPPGTVVGRSSCMPYGYESLGRAEVELDIVDVAIDRKCGGVGTSGGGRTDLRQGVRILAGLQVMSVFSVPCDEGTIQILLFSEPRLECLVRG